MAYISLKQEVLHILHMDQEPCLHLEQPICVLKKVNEHLDVGVLVPGPITLPSDGSNVTQRVKDTTLKR